MSQFNYITNTGGSANSILTETGNSGGAVPPDGFGNLGVIGVDGFNVTGVPGSNALNLTNLRNVSYYVVGPDATQSEYTSIQDAIDQAVSDGADVNNPALVWIVPGIYTENVTFADYVYVSTGSGGVEIQGNCSYPATGGQCYLSNLSITSPNGSSALSASGNGTLHYKFGSITAGLGFALDVSTNMTVSLFNSTLIAPVAFSSIISMNGGTLNIFNGVLNNNNTTSVLNADAVINISSVIHYGAGFTVNDTASFTMTSSYLIDLLTNNPNLILDNGSTASVTGSLFYSTNVSGYFITGFGFILYSTITPFGTATQLDPNLAINGSTVFCTNITFDGNQTSVSGNGKLIIGGTGLPSIANLTPGAGIGIQNGSGSITIDAIGTVSEVLGTSQAITSGVTYIANNAGSITFTLPSTAIQGSFIKIIGKGAGTYTIAQQAGQTIYAGASGTTTGVTGVVTATQQYTSLHLVCITANTSWVIVDSSGTFTLA